MNEVKSASSACAKTDVFYQTFVDAVDEFFPTKSVSTQFTDKPWINAELKSLIVKRHTAFNSGKLCLWRLLLNKIIRLIKRTKIAFYNCNVARLRLTKLRQWHQQIQKMTGLNRQKKVLLPGASSLNIAN